MNGKRSAGRFTQYAPPKLDARAGEARSLLSNRPTLDGLNANALRCQFNLKPSTAEFLIADEASRRENAGRSQLWPRPDAATDISPLRVMPSDAREPVCRASILSKCCPNGATVFRHLRWTIRKVRYQRAKAIGSRPFRYEHLSIRPTSGRSDRPLRLSRPDIHSSQSRQQLCAPLEVVQAGSKQSPKLPPLRQREVAISNVTAFRAF
jgi:hypothetical protein